MSTDTTLDRDIQVVLADASERYREAESSGEFARFWEAEADRRATRRAEAMRKIATASGCPPEEAELVLGGHIVRTKVLDRVRMDINLGWSSAGRPRPGVKHWLVVTGMPGAGKTLASVWALLLGTVDERGEPLPGDRIYVTSREVADLNAGFGPDRARAHELATAKWLVLDDVGYLDTGRDGCLAPSVQRLLNDRHEQRRRTIITTNLSPQQLWGYVEYQEDGATPRLPDRLAQLATVIVTTEPSLRRSPPGSA